MTPNLFLIFYFLILGIVLILNTLKILPWDIWKILWRFWPVFLLMAILQVLSRKRKKIAIITLGLGIGTLSAIIFFSLSLINNKFYSIFTQLNPAVSRIRTVLGLDPGEKLSSLTIISGDDFEGIKNREINISIGLGEFNLTDNTGSEYLAVKSQYYKFFGKPEISSANNQGSLNITLNTQKNLKPIFGATEDTKYDISIGQPEIPTVLKLNSDASIFKSKFQNLKLSSLSINVGAGNSEVIISKNSLPKESFNVNAGAGTLRIILPFDAFIKVNYIVGVGALYVDSERFTRSGSYTIPKFGISEDPLPIDISIGAGTIYIDTSGKI